MKPMQDEWEKFMAFYKSQLFPDEESIPIDHAVLMEAAFFMGGYTLACICAQGREYGEAVMQEIKEWHENKAKDMPWVKYRQ